MKFSEKEQMKTIELIKKVCNGTGINLDETDYPLMNYFWNDIMRKEVNACWSALKPLDVFVTNSFHYNSDADGFRKLIPHIMHELRHKQQKNVMGIFYFLFSIPVIRNFTIEVDANSVTRKVYEFFKIDESEWL